MKHGDIIEFKRRRQSQKQSGRVTAIFTGIGTDVIIDFDSLAMRKGRPGSVKLSDIVFLRVLPQRSGPNGCPTAKMERKA